ncbi:NlpC/P60 family protein [Streptomyces cellulosae]
MAPERTSRPGGSGLPGMRNSALATAALTSVALLSQTPGAAAATGDDGPSRDEVRQRVNSLYDQAETDTGTYNATRAAAIPRQRSGATAAGERRGAGSAAGTSRETPDPALADVARQWFDVARSKLGPTVAAALPADRIPARPARAPEARPARPAERTTDALALEAPKTADRATPELTARPVPELAGGSAPALPSAPDTTGQGTATALPAASTADSGSSSLRATKQRNQQKLARAREVLAAHNAQLSTPPAAIESRPAEDPWHTPAQTALDSTGTQWQLPRTGLTPELPVTPDFPAAPALGVFPDLPVTPAPTVTTPPPVTPASVGPAPMFAPGPPAEAASSYATGLPTGPTAPYAAGLLTDPNSTYATGLPTTSAPAFTAALPTDTTFTPAHGTPVHGTPAHGTPIHSTPAHGTPVQQVTAFESHTPAAPTPAPTAPVAPAQAVDAGYDLKAAKVLAFARAQIGRPCVWGAAGPGSYDASGLTQAAWKTAGVELPRAAQAQAGVGTAVALTDVRVGDLVFFYDDLSHVGLYIGNGMMIHAPGPGAYIREESVYYAGESAIRGAIRPA